MIIQEKSIPHIFRNKYLRDLGGAVKVGGSGGGTVTTVGGDYLPANLYESETYKVDYNTEFLKNLKADLNFEVVGDTILNNLTVNGDSNLKNTNIDGDINLTGKIYVNGEEFNGGGESYLKNLKDVNYNWEDVYNKGYLKYNGNTWLYQSIEEHKLETGVSNIESSLTSIYERLNGLEYKHFDIDTNRLSGNGNPWDDYQDFIMIRLVLETRTNVFRLIRAFRIDVEISDDWGTSVFKFNAIPDWGADGTDAYAAKYSILGLGPHSTFYFAANSNNHYVPGHKPYIIIPISSEWYHKAKHVMVKARCNEVRYEPLEDGGKVYRGNFVSDISVVSGSINEYGYYTNINGEILSNYKFVKYNTTSTIEKFVSTSFSNYGVDISNSSSTNFNLYDSFTAKNANINSDINLRGNINFNPSLGGLYWDGTTYVSILKDSLGLLLGTDSRTNGTGNIRLITNQNRDSIILNSTKNVLLVGNTVTINDNRVLTSLDLDALTNSELFNEFKESVYTKDLTHLVINERNDRFSSLINSWMSPLTERLNNVEDLLGDLEILLDKILGYETNEYLNETLDEIIG